MAGSGPNQQQTKANNNNSALKAQHSGNQNQNVVGANGTASPRFSAPMDVPSAAPSLPNGPPASNGGGIVVTANGGENATHNLLHDCGLAMEWTPEEQNTLEEALAKYALQTDNLLKYIKIAAQLQDKTVRDVALRCRWMTKKENGKRRKDEVQSGTKKSKDKKDKAETAPKQMSTVMARSPMPMYTPPPPPIDNDDGISNDAIGGTTGHLLEQNAQVIVQIRSNLAAMKMQENTELLVRFRDNIFAILNGMTNMPGIMSQMPPLPVKLNTDLADTILPKQLAQNSAALQLQS